MCFGSAPKMPKSPTPPPIQRMEGPVARLYQRRRLSAQGVFGNIFSTTLGGGSANSYGGTPLGDTGMTSPGRAG